MTMRKSKYGHMFLRLTQYVLYFTPMCAVKLPLQIGCVFTHSKLPWVKFKSQELIIRMAPTSLYFEIMYFVTIVTNIQNTIAR